MAKDLRIAIVGDASSYSRALKKAGGETQTFGSKLGGLGKTAGLAAGAAALGGFAVAVHRGFDEMKQAALAMAQTNAVLKSTGGIANVTATHVTELSNSLSKISGVDDEVIQGGENMLLTFKNIRNEVGAGNKIFDQATAAVLDMSVAMGKDLQSTAILVGKALNDPVKGMSALRRVGVTLSDSQKDLVEKLVNTGHSMEAQKIILHELTSEFGGSAKAAGDTLPGQLNKLQNAFDELAAKGLQAAFDKFEEMKPTIDTLIGVFNDLQVVLAPMAKLIFDELFLPMKLVGDLISGDFSKAWTDIKAPIIDLRNIFVGFWSLIKGPFETFIGGVTGGLTAIRTKAETVTGDIAGFFTAIPSKIGDFGGALLNKIQNVFGSAGVGGWISGVVTSWAGFIADLPGKVGDFGKSLLGKITGFIDNAGIGTYLTDKIDDFAGFFTSLPGKIGDALGRGVTGAIGKLKSWFNDLFGWLPGWAKDILGIHSPSTVFAEIGEHIVGGLIKGLGSMSGALKKKVEDLIGVPIDWANKAISAIGGALGGEATGGYKNIASHLLGSYGWAATEFVPLQSLWEGESGWSPIAYNPDSHAQGIPQFLPMPGRPTPEGFPDNPPINPVAQIQWGLAYIKSKYGSPSAAYNFWLSKSPHWYAKGGIFTKPSIIGVGEKGPEAVVPLGKMRGDTYVTVNMPNYLGDKKEAARTIRDEIVRLNRDNAILGT